MDRQIALQILKDIHDTALFSTRAALETLIPELDEKSEHEIPKEIYEFFLDKCEFDFVARPDRQRWLTWLKGKYEYAK